MKDIFNLALIILNVWVLIIGDFSSNTNIKVDVKGMVNKPGVYTISKYSTVNDVIKLAGGLKDNADTSVINLSKRLKDSDVIIIYSDEEIEEMKSGSTAVKYVDKECICPMIDNTSLFNSAITNMNEYTVKTGKISLNSATIEELVTIPGIGESKAKLIIEYREANNGFKSIDEIMNVKGIGKSSFEKIKDYLTL